MVRSVAAAVMAMVTDTVMAMVTDMATAMEQKRRSLSGQDPGSVRKKHKQQLN